MRESKAGRAVLDSWVDIRDAVDQRRVSIYAAKIIC
jgi:hypothetical protein